MTLKTSLGEVMVITSAGTIELLGVSKAVVRGAYGTYTSSPRPAKSSWNHVWNVRPIGACVVVATEWLSSHSCNREYDMVLLALKAVSP